MTRATRTITMKRCLSAATLALGLPVLSSCGPLTIGISSPKEGETVRGNFVVMHTYTSGGVGAPSFTCSVDGAPASPCPPCGLGLICPTPPSPPDPTKFAFHDLLQGAHT